MVEASVFDKLDYRLEPIEGELIERPIMGRQHISALGRIHRALVTRLSGRALILCQTPLIMAAHDSVPVPDFSVLRDDPRDYADRRPEPADVHLAIAVAYSSLAFDIGRKMRLYSRASIAEYWVVDLEAEQLAVFRDPGPESYGTLVRFDRGESITMLAFPHVRFAVENLLLPA